MKKFTKWKHADHNHLAAPGANTRYANGVIPDGVSVQFVDKQIGRVVTGNNERSLISYTPDRLTGCTEARDWFRNDALKIPASK